MKKIIIALALLNLNLNAFSQEKTTNQNSPAQQETKQESNTKTETPQKGSALELKSINKILDKITPKEDSPLEKKILAESAIDDKQHFYYLDKLNYLLPYYYTSSPYDSVYKGNTANKQKLSKSEFKGQISVGVPIVKSLFGHESMSLEASFSQTVFWQTYVESQYFRSTDTEISIFYKYHFHKNWLMTIGPDHQSNGKGLPLERSWNRLITKWQFSGENFYFESYLWTFIFGEESIKLHNSDIEKFLGHDIFTFSYKVNKLNFGLSIQNIEKIFKYGNFLAWVSYPISNQLNVFAQYFYGYGQTLIEYNHFTQGFGVGFSFNNYL